ncbi:hypothetical protein B0H17DRAFT_561328 [Mycena rosella]|uniref:Uncharacterized protein n=1 Tax=Mycena rosella TaxID=1033263 RepID=A0AAD7GHQ2_MYCRO|nr:hypothetical protein B0H17DRAFT_561328 [Mycena rosella]
MPPRAAPSSSPPQGQGQALTKRQRQALRIHRPLPLEESPAASPPALSAADVMKERIEREEREEREREAREREREGAREREAARERAAREREREEEERASPSKYPTPLPDDEEEEEEVLLLRHTDEPLIEFGDVEATISPPPHIEVEPARVQVEPAAEAHKEAEKVEKPARKRRVSPPQQAHVPPAQRDGQHQHAHTRAPEAPRPPPPRALSALSHTLRALEAVTSTATSVYDRATSTTAYARRASLHVPPQFSLNSEGGGYGGGRDDRADEGEDGEDAISGARWDEVAVVGLGAGRCVSSLFVSLFSALGCGERGISARQARA